MLPVCYTISFIYDSVKCTIWYSLYPYQNQQKLQNAYVSVYSERNLKVLRIDLGLLTQEWQNIFMIERFYSVLKVIKGSVLKFRIKLNNTRYVTFYTV